MQTSLKEYFLKHTFGKINEFYVETQIGRVIWPPFCNSCIHNVLRSNFKSFDKKKILWLFLGTWINKKKNISKDEDSRSSEGTCDKVLITLMIKNNSLVLSLNSACYILDTQLLILSLHTSLKSLLVFSVSSSQRDADSKNHPWSFLFFFNSHRTNWVSSVSSFRSGTAAPHPSGGFIYTDSIQWVPLHWTQTSVSMPVCHRRAQEFMVHQMGVTSAE